MPCKREQHDIPQWKGKSGIDIKEQEKVFIIVEWKKVEDDKGGFDVKEAKHILPKENVTIVRDVLANIESKRYKDGKIPCRNLANKIMERLQITRFHSESGVFSWEKFFGCRADYYKYYYLPLKVLVSKREVMHHKNGKISKMVKNKNS